jgi:type IV secretory pathway TraG/TraD family ATPase VirD4
MWQILAIPFKLLWWVVLWLAYLWGFIERWIYRLITGEKGLDTHGSAKWATAKELKPFFAPVGWYVARYEGKRVYTGAERNVLLCAPPGQGKTQTLIATLLDLAERGQTDILVNDPAGDIENATRAAYEAKGYRVWCINIADPPRTNIRYNPLSFLQPELHFDYERDVQTLANLILPDDVHSKEEHFQNFARMMLVAAIIKGNMGEESLTLYDVVNVLSDPAQMRRYFESGIPSDSLLVRQAYKAFEAAGDKEKGSFITTLARKLTGWGQKAMRYLLQDDPEHPWTWEDIYKDSKPTIIFLRAGLGTNEGAVSRLILGNAINTRRRMWNKGEKFNRPLKIVVDEALTIGNCAAIQDAVNELRKAGVNLFMCWLSLQSVKDTLNQAETIINACELIVFGGGRDMRLYKEVSDLMGDKTIESGSRNENEHGESKGASEQARKLIKPDELRALPNTELAMTIGPLNVRANKPYQITKKGIEY